MVGSGLWTCENIIIFNFSSETWDEDKNPGDQEQGAGEDVDQQRVDDKQQRTQRPGSWRGVGESEE